MTAAQKLLLILIPAAYLAGSVPFGLLVGFAKGVDVRKAGSGNIGATNVARLLGGKFFALVFTLDLLKGLLPVLAAGMVLRGQARVHAAADSSGNYMLWLLVGLAAIFGHMFSLFLKFKGGKGVATSAGVVLGVFPYFTLPGVVALIVAALAFKVTRYVSVASIGGAVAFPLAYIAIGLTAKWNVFGVRLPLLGFAILMAGMIIAKHRTNLARLRAGTEHRFGAKRPIN